MRKKSHISLAKHIVNVSDLQHLDKHRMAFYVGSILPDCKPSFLTQRHEINGTFELVSAGVERLTQGYQDMEQLSTLYFTRLGEILHYIADYFTYPHNKEYEGNMKEHCVYEGKLKHELRAYIRKIGEQNIEVWKKSIQLEDFMQFHSVAEICEFIRNEHRQYIRRGRHCVEEDCKYIVGICTKIAFAILSLCVKGIEECHGKTILA
ncbi:MAG: zinc dependent phospholipase C family protein [Lachnospiraceae bacterium]|nr:zinc dependent phospholipase C family protein [Lachnospiraceae bacterium]